MKRMQGLPPPPVPVELPRGFEIRTNFFLMYSPKMGRTIKFYSRLEYLHGLLIEGNVAALQYCEQALRLHLGERNFVMDMWIRWSDGRQEYREVKPASELVEDLSGHRVPTGWPAFSQWCEQHQYECNFVTDIDLQKNQVTALNWQRILPWVQMANRTHEDDLFEDFAEYVQSHGDTVIPLAEVRRHFHKVAAELVVAGLAKLLHSGRIQANLNAERFGWRLGIRTSQVQANG